MRVLVPATERGAVEVAASLIGEDGILAVREVVAAELLREHPRNLGHHRDRAALARLRRTDALPQVAAPVNADRFCLEVHVAHAQGE